MAIFYSASTGGFYDPQINVFIPGDAVEISAEVHAALLDGQAQGQRIEAGQNGHPALFDPLSDPEALSAERRQGMRCSRFQARAALHLAGLLAVAEAAVAGAPVLTQIAWADAQEFQRMSPTIAALSAALGLTDVQIDALFDSAMQITA